MQLLLYITILPLKYSSYVKEHKCNLWIQKCKYEVLLLTKYQNNNNSVNSKAINTLLFSKLIGWITAELVRPTYSWNIYIRNITRPLHWRCWKVVFTRLTMRYCCRSLNCCWQKGIVKIVVAWNNIWHFTSIPRFYLIHATSAVINISINDVYHLS